MPSVMGKCRSCGKELVWATSASGKKTPLEAVSLSEGNIRIVGGVCVIGLKGTGPYVSHFATCPDANKWRGKGRDDDDNNGGTAA